MKGTLIIQYTDESITATDVLMRIVAIILLIMSVLFIVKQQWSMAICNTIWLVVEVLSAICYRKAELALARAAEDVTEIAEEIERLQKTDNK